MIEARANDASGSLLSMGRPTMGEERNDILRRLVEELKDTDYKGNLTATAEAIGIKAGTLSPFLKGERGAGEKTTDGLRKLLGFGLDQMIASGGSLKALRGQPPAASPPPHATTFGELPNWRKLRAEAQREEPHPDWVWDYLETAVVWLRIPVTAAVVSTCAANVAKHIPPAARRRLGPAAALLRPPWLPRRRQGVAQELPHLDLDGVGERDERAHRQVLLPALHLLDVGARHVEPHGEFVLRQPDGLAQLGHPAADRAQDRAYVVPHCPRRSSAVAARKHRPRR